MHGRSRPPAEGRGDPRAAPRSAFPGQRARGTGRGAPHVAPGRIVTAASQWLLRFSLRARVESREPNDSTCFSSGPCLMGTLEFGHRCSQSNVFHLLSKRDPPALVSKAPRGRPQRSGAGQPGRRAFGCSRTLGHPSRQQGQSPQSRGRAVDTRERHGATSRLPGFPGRPGGPHSHRGRSGPLRGVGTGARATRPWPGAPGVCRAPETRCTFRCRARRLCRSLRWGSSALCSR